MFVIYSSFVTYYAGLTVFAVLVS